MIAERRRRVGVLVSGSGTNLRALLDAAERPDFPATVVLVLSNRPSAGALDLAAARGVDAEAMPVSGYDGDVARRDAAMLDRLRAAGVELVVSAGYDRVLDDALVTAYADAILNIHPSLLPAFGGGMHAIEEALAAGVKVTGCTVHLMDPGAVDGGAIVAQAAVPVLEDDDVASLRERIHEQEWRILPDAVRLWAEGRLRRDGRRVVVAADPVRPQARADGP